MVIKLVEIKNVEPRREHGNLDGLKKSILEIGLINPLTIDENMNLLTGRRRYQALCELGFTKLDDIQVRILPVSGDKLKSFKVALDENLKRKPLTNPEIAAAIKEYDELKKKIEGSAKGGTRTDLGHNITEVDGWSYQKTADDLGVSKPAVVKAIKIATAIEEHPEWAKERSVKILHKWGEQKGQFKLKEIIDTDEKVFLPQGTYDVIYADPPWRYDFDVESRATEKHYPTLTVDKIAHYKDSSGIPVQEKFAENAILYLWATAPKLNEAMVVIQEWGFTYKTNMVWVKDKIGLGWYCRNQHELLLIAEKGDMPLPKPSVRPSSVLHFPRTNHSRKPREIYDLIERCYPDRKYLAGFEIKLNRPNWASFGNEVYE